MVSSVAGHFHRPSSSKEMETGPRAAQVSARIGHNPCFDSTMCL